MNVGQICHRNPVTIGATDELATAAELMRERHVGYLVVVENAAGGDMKPVGVLTDRDIVISVVARQTDPGSLRVGDIMTRDPIIARESAPFDQALQAMRRMGVRRLPVVNDRRCLTGVLSLDDVLDALAVELQSVAASIRTEQRIEGELRS